MKWLRPEFEGREDELETRADFEKRTGISAMSFSSHCTRYADHVPDVVALNGKKKFYVARELDGFISWIKENAGTRTEEDVTRSKMARLRSTIADTDVRLETHRLGMEKAQKDKGKYVRQLSRLESDLRLMEQNG